jgi:hypothetical protein
MAQALVGLIGVIVGGLLAGGVTFFMARRADARKTRAAARLLEAELRPVVQQLDALSSVVTPVGTRLVAADFVNVREILSFPQPRLWNEYKSSLAEALNRCDWDALVRAYDGVDVLRRIGRSKSALTESGEIYHDAIAGLVNDLARDVRAGADALAGLTGGATLATDTSGSLNNQLIRFLMQEASAASSSANSARNTPTS